MFHLTSPATESKITQAKKDLGGYLKITIDLENKKAVIGGKMHMDGEKMLLEKGFHQGDIWGGGFDGESGQIDYNSIINLRPHAGNFSEEIILPEVRKKFENLVKFFLNL